MKLLIIFPDWLMITVLPIAFIICALLWLIRNQRREIRKMKDDFDEQKRQDDLIIRQFLRHHD